MKMKEEFLLSSTVDIFTMQNSFTLNFLMF